jgi:hypothetical protein
MLDTRSICTTVCVQLLVSCFVSYVNLITTRHQVSYIYTTDTIQTVHTTLCYTVSQ